MANQCCPITGYPIIKLGEYGKVIRLAVGYDMTNATSVKLSFTSPRGTVFVPSGVTVPAEDIPGYSSGNEYFQYTIADGDFDEVGLWTMRGTYEDNNKRLVSGDAYFLVEA